jgi:outer membrane lipoprotein-sorting protein
MRPADDINKSIKKWQLKASARLDKRIHDGISEALAESEKTESAVLQSDIWRTIMKNPITKLAAAAAIIIAALIGISQITSSSVALADVLAKVEQIKTYMYKINMKVTGSVITKISPWGQDMTGTVTISEDFGIKTEMEMIDPNTGETTKQENYIIPDEKLFVEIMHEQKRFTRSEFSDDLLARMKKQHNDPRELIRQMLGLKYTELGKSEIDGVEVDGFETTDPRASDGTTGDVKVTLWVDSKSWLPVLVEMDMSINEQGRIRSTYYDYQWDVPVEKSEFVPVIPDDYEAGPGDGMKWPEMTEEAAIEGLRLVADLVGRYPKQASIVDLMAEISPIMFEHVKKDLPEDVTDTELETKMIEAILPLQSLGMFYMTLVQDKKEPAYYGEKVTPEFPHAVLMRWKKEDGNYRVIFGDLTIEDVTPDELAELEAAPLNIKPTAIRPQPVDGGSVAFYAETRLGWMPGAYLSEHKVYFGTSVDQMLLLAEVADSCSVMAPALEKAVTYYWRVDEVQPDGSIATGDIWSFDTGKLVGFWKLDGDADDSSGNENHGTINGDPNLVSGQIGSALQFDGIDDSVRTYYAADLPTWTIALWVKSPAAPSSKAAGGPVHRENNFQINWNHTSADFRGAAGLRVANQWYTAGFGQLQADTWYHLAATYDGENLKAYKNGVLITDNPDPSGAPDKESTTLKFARHANYGDHFEGTIDDVRIYSYDLTDEEVASIYATGKEEK